MANGDTYSKGLPVTRTLALDQTDLSADQFDYTIIVIRCGTKINSMKFELEQSAFALIKTIGKQSGLLFYSLA